MNERIKLLVEQDGFQCIKDKALRLALGALQRFIKYDYNENPFDGKDVEGAEAITAIKEALAQPEQEPVAYLCENAVGHKYFRWKKPSSTYKPIALYTTQPQRTWVGLTDEEIWETISRIGTSDSDVNPYAKLADARAIEAKLKEKNT